MDEAVKTHKENTFGWMLAIQELITTCRDRLRRLAQKQAAEAAKTASRRHLAPR
jgi:hypothetical protein